MGDRQGIYLVGCSAIKPSLMGTAKVLDLAGGCVDRGGDASHRS